MMLYWGIFTVGFYLGIIFNLALWSKKDNEEFGMGQNLKQELPSMSSEKEEKYLIPNT
ncbi:MAG: hypothetical protein M1575_00955 [Patescibacteria group bacterium]|nr:hypothetical protein [Patescibacteria group bacterium]MCL5095290.1 hypothetical protein [Patescibacteria group bacterium]